MRIPRLLPTWMAAIIGIAVVGAASLAEMRDAEQKLQRQFRSQVEVKVNVLQQALQEIQRGVQTYHALFATDPRLTYYQFDRFGSQLPQERDEVVASGRLARVPRIALSEFEIEAREHFPDYHVFNSARLVNSKQSAAVHPYLYPVYFVRPRGSVGEGTDFAANPLLRQAINEAWRTGKPTLSQLFRADFKGSQTAMLLLLRPYGEKGETAPVAGLSFSLIDVSRLLNGVYRRAPDPVGREVRLTLLDMTDASFGRRLYPANDVAEAKRGKV